jgi:putative transposase
VEHYPKIHWPVNSTIGELLRREGLAVPRKKRRRTPPYTQPFQSITQPNDLWCADFKGWFRTRDGERIDPLTMTDAHSRYLLRCQSVDKANLPQVKAIYVAAFREFGMPLTIRTDNGPPFATRAIAGLSRLSVWLMKLGIIPERIKAGHPEQNGRHERMHATMKAETAKPPEANRRAQQRRFDQFRTEYNEVRPHEALGQKTPSSQYLASPRGYPERVPEPEYPDGMQTRRVQHHGAFSWKHQDVFITEALDGECVGLEQNDERYWLVNFAGFPIASFDSHELKTRPLPKKTKIDEK